MEREFISLNLAVLAIAEDSAAEALIATHIADRLAAEGHKIAARGTVTDDEEAIRDRLKRWIADPGIDVVIAAGDIESEAAPAALAPLVTKTLPGFCELFRVLAYQDIGAAAVQSNAEAAECGPTIVFVLPASLPAVTTGLDKLLVPQLDHRTKPRNLVMTLPRVRATSSTKIPMVIPPILPRMPAIPAANAVPVPIEGEKTAGGLGLASRPPAVPIVPARTTPRVVVPHKHPLDDVPTRPIELAQLLPLMSSGTEPAMLDAPTQRVVIGLPSVPPGADEFLDVEPDQEVARPPVVTPLKTILPQRKRTPPAVETPQALHGGATEVTPLPAKPPQKPEPPPKPPKSETPVKPVMAELHEVRDAAFVDAVTTPRMIEPVTTPREPVHAAEPVTTPREPAPPLIPNPPKLPEPPRPPPEPASTVVVEAAAPVEPPATPVARPRRPQTQPPPLPRQASTSTIGVVGELPRGQFVYPTKRKNKGARALLFVLGGLVVVAAGFFVTVRLFPPAKKAAGPPVVAVVTADAAPAIAPPVTPDVPIDAADVNQAEIVMEPDPTPPTGHPPAHPPPTTPGTHPPVVPATPRDAAEAKPEAKPDAAVAEVKPPEPPVDPDCDEVSCALEHYARPCCERYKKPDPGFKPTSGLHESLDKAMVLAGVETVKPVVIACGEKHPAKGIVKISLTVSSDGQVKDASADESPDPELGKCVAAAMRKARFGKTVNGGTFTYPFAF